MNNETIVEEFNLLLNNFWILKENNPSDFYRIRKHLKELRDIANNKLGCDIICNNKLVKLEKLPIKEDNVYQLANFDKRLDYVLFIVLLLFLEDKGIDEQFVLSQFSEYVENILVGIEGEVKPDWKKYQDRKSLVDVLKYAQSMGIIRLRDGNDTNYAENIETEALYENTTLSHFVIRNFKFDIFSCKKASDFLEKELEDLDAINKKRYLTYRGLLFYPNIILDELGMEVSQYLKNMRGRIKEDIEKFLEGEFILTKNMGLISLEGSKDRDLFPNYRKSISDIALLVNSYMQDKKVDEKDKIVMTDLEFKKLLAKVQEENKNYFSKEYREMASNKFQSVVASFMESYGLLKKDDDKYIIYPVCFLIQGKYLENNGEEDEVKNYDLISLFEEEEV